jgi:hypothetical protein
LALLVAAYSHILRRASCVRIFLGWDVLVGGILDFLSGGAMVGMATGADECGGAYVFRFVRILGHGA